jgi:hypothetical protein
MVVDMAGVSGKFKESEDHAYNLPPIVLKLADSAFASNLNPTIMVATITPAIRPYSRAVTARRSVLICNRIKR